MGFKKNVIAFFVISVLGTLSHFIYNFSGEMSVVGLFFPVNESVWEHLKMILFPALIYSIFEYFTINEKPKNYFTATVSGIYCGMFTIIAIYYIVNGIIGKDVEFVNIASYYVGVIALLIKRSKIIDEEKLTSKNAKLFLSVILVINIILFFVWSFNPPSLGIFTPPQ